MISLSSGPHPNPVRRHLASARCRCLQAALKGHETLAHFEDFTVRNDRPLGEVAAEILVMAGWMSGEDG